MNTPNKARFVRNVKDNDMRGGGILQAKVNYKLPSSTEMNQLRKFKVIYDVDPDIRKPIIELNRMGFKTSGSCAGHSNRAKGFISIDGSPSQAKINVVFHILRKYGFKNMHIGKKHHANDHFWAVIFDSVGVISHNAIYYRDVYSKIKNRLTNEENSTWIKLQRFVESERTSPVDRKLIYRRLDRLYEKYSE